MPGPPEVVEERIDQLSHYPDKDIWWEIVERYRVSVFYTAPTAIRPA